ncbi:putative helicase [Fibrobacter succinogenes subsp. succinogenes S85]|uniref:DNA 3'-5' helicase n=1 Tax=Fibrobacter succinogenes (strain ATCC 19169 / S85) TaxID=59374 RepID=C9RK00_FIBSS|nr:DNA repair helicase XPB [Fibrobacter succinogenes]ACX75733.1 type III restriction protein res subunit [Fibrobacter succinogenes subsp. succinogenes S85]ADL26012.1 putative helicase [Fibrobacter succinogenes subsp. succinogenes S85]
MNPNGAIIVQSNLEIMVEVDNPNYTTARDAIAPFTELVKSPEHLHTYKISHLSLWNAAATGLRAPEVLERLESQSRYPIPPTVVTEIEDYMARYGLLRLKKEDDRLLMESDDKLMFLEICKLKDVEPFIIEHIDDTHVVVDPERRGHLKMVLTNAGFPVEDLAGYTVGDPLPIQLRETTVSGKPFKLRDYQKDAAQVFYASGSEKGGSGVIVLPCGSGKTVIGLATMALVQTKTLILTPNISSSRQWIREICDKTNLTLDQVKEYSGEVKEIGPVTVATYQILTQRKRAKKGDENKEGKEPEMTEEEVKKELANFPLFSQEKWGLMIYDEVHLLPAPVFRLSTEMQATRRLGLTATLVREDHKETEVFSLIGPKKFDIPWRILEAQGWIATADCNEIRIPMDPELKMKYALAPVRDKITLASTNPEKTDIVERLLKYFSKPDDRVLIIGQYIDQLEALSEDLQIPLITGKTPNKEREKLYGAFRSGAQKNLMVSKVGNFAIDLPDANVLIQISGTFGSRQEEAQRLGRVLRPKSDGGAAHFYSIVTQDSKEQEFAMNRQLFLTEQGYAYKIIKRGDWDILMRTPEELAARA